MEVSHLEMPVWDMSKTCFQIYGTKRKTTFSCEDEPEDKLCPVAKRVCVSPSGSTTMEEDRLPESQVMAVTHQPMKDKEPVVSTASSPCHQQLNHQQRESVMNWLSWQNGHLAGWKEAIWSHDDKAKSGGSSGHYHCRGDRRETLRNGELKSPRLEMEEDGGSGNWQTPDNLHRQLMKQMQSPDLCQTRQETLKAKAEKLKAQLQYIKSMNVKSNDYWALPQENQLVMEDELEQARIAMETDFAPDPFQYHCSDIPVPMAGHDSGPVNQVRCYCKPNWEGMMDPIGYI